MTVGRPKASGSGYSYRNRPVPIEKHIIHNIIHIVHSRLDTLANISKAYIREWQWHGVSTISIVQRTVHLWEAQKHSPGSFAIQQPTILLVLAYA